jgi:hypothetical protein
MGVHRVAHEATTHYTYVHRTVTSTAKDKQSINDVTTHPHTCAQHTRALQLHD